MKNDFDEAGLTKKMDQEQRAELIVEAPQTPIVGTTHQTTVIVGNEQSPFGYWGLLLSLCGAITCGLTSVPGFLLSLCGMFARGPKACAIWGTVLGLIGSIPFGVFVFPFLLFGLLGLIGIGAAGAGAGASLAANPNKEVPQAISPDPEPSILEPAREPLDLQPEDVEPQKTEEQLRAEEVARLEIEKADQAVLKKMEVERLSDVLSTLEADEPKLPPLGYRKWTAKSGQSVSAKLIRISSTHIQIEKEDGTKVSVARDQLEKGEQDELARKYSTHVATWDEWKEAVETSKSRLKKAQEEVKSLEASLPPSP